MRLSFILKSVSDLPTEPEEINLKIKRNYPLFQNPFPISNVKSVSKCLFLCLFPFLVSRNHYRCPFSASIPVQYHSSFVKEMMAQAKYELNLRSPVIPVPYQCDRL